MLPLFTLASMLTCAALVAAGPELSVRDLSGSKQSIVPGGEILVVTFISTACPVSNDYNDRMSAVYNEYAKKGVKFFFVNANSNESVAEVAEHRKEVGFPFAVYKDESAAEKLNAQATPETFVFDKVGKLQYRGYIDDARNPARIQDNGLRNALDAVMAGKPVAHATTKAFGCTIKRARRS